MTKKIGRNDPCPCGSGKKYKQCCLNAEESRDFSAWHACDNIQSSSLDAPKLTEYLKTHDVIPIIDYLIALQLNPENNGKNLRIEHICQLVVSSLGKSKVKPDLHKFKQLIDEEYPYDLMEDIPINLFCETVLFYGGNYVFFPGLTTHCSELFRSMTETIYRKDTAFSDAFIAEIYQGVTLMLKLGTSIASQNGIVSTIIGNDNPRSFINDPISFQSYCISKSGMVSLLTKNHIENSILDLFIIDIGNDKILTSSPDENPVLYQPIVEYENSYYFLGIINQGCAINNFILKTAIKHGCIYELVKYTQDTIWNRFGMSCVENIHWLPIQFNKFNSIPDEHYNEQLFRIDDNWVAYVCYAKDTKNDISVDGSNHITRWNIDERLNRSLSCIRNDEKTSGFHILTIVVYSTMGEPFTLSFNKQRESDFLIYFSVFDFLQLIQTENWDNMSLVRYARTMENTPSLSFGFNQPLDCYSFYKLKGECFYLSDKPKPNILQIEPNEGCKLIHESKDRLNFHGVPIRLDSNVNCYIPVQRDKDYAYIYKPLDTSINAKCCESYSVPIWVRCTQVEIEGENPSSITDTIITAVAHWMDRLSPAIRGIAAKIYNDPIEINLQFEEKTLSDKYIHHDLISSSPENGVMTVKKRDLGLVVSFNDGFIHGFLGADNSQEREMMKRIVSTLFGVQESDIKSIIDEYIPLGPAKMILMREASNSPISIPLWLNPPIYIHSASNQLILDLFPEWMSENNYDISERLEGKELKDSFLHNGVEILYNKLSEEVARFDSFSLLRRLISNHETLLFQREHNKMLHPAQLLCFGDNEDKRKEIFDKEKRLTEAGLASRAMIEYVASKQSHEGKECAGSDDIEWMLTIMNEIIYIGGICEAVHLEVSDHIIEKLESGRYGIYDDTFNDNIYSFASARSNESVNNQMDDFENKMKRLANLHKGDIGEKDADTVKIDEAFSNDWGVTYTSILKVLYGCYLIAMRKNHSVIEIEEKTFGTSIKEFYPELNDISINNALDHLTLEIRKHDQMPQNELFPWIYNREFCFLRRPIVKWRTGENSTLLVFGFRSCLLAGYQLSDLLYSGRLKYVGTKLEKLLGKFQAEKGKAFNDEVRNWLIENSTLKVWQFDVSIKPKGNIASSDNLGDIDVLAYDNVRNVLYSIECKNTNTAKNIREMKKEMDDYLGRGENLEKDKKKALVMKHLRRDQWLKNNIDKVVAFVGAKSAPSIKSMMLTSEVIPTSYLRKEDTPLSILSFQELKRKGIDYLDRAKDVTAMA